MVILLCVWARKAEDRWNSELQLDLEGRIKFAEAERSLGAVDIGAVMRMYILLEAQTNYTSYYFSFLFPG